jgi:3-methyl-2-oxobutanoate hydroxymethyltransferase
MKQSIENLRKYKNSKKIAVLTAYDFPTAQVADACGIDVVLVGDSVGTNVLGYPDVLQVTMEDMLHHVRAVARGADHAFVLADLPFHSYETPRQCLENAMRLIADKADGVKIEGELEVVDSIRLLTQYAIPVCAHIGYTPQKSDGKPTAQGKDVRRAQELISSALALEKAGAFMIVIELVTEQVVGEITRLLKIPTIGIGSGPLCDGQVLVVHDMIGMTAKTFKHALAFGNAREELAKSISRYAAQVARGGFPTSANATAMAPEMFAQVKDWVNRNAFAADPNPIRDTPGNF